MGERERERAKEEAPRRKTLLLIKPIFVSRQTTLVDLPSSHAPNSNYSYALLSDLSSSFFLSFLGLLIGARIEERLSICSMSIDSPGRGDC